MLDDKSEGSRLEIAGVRTLAEAEEALAMLRNLGANGGDLIHCYLSGTALSLWTGRTEEA